MKSTLLKSDQQDKYNIEYEREESSLKLHFFSQRHCKLKFLLDRISPHLSSPSNSQGAAHSHPGMEECGVKSVSVLPFTSSPGISDETLYKESLTSLFVST